MMKETVCKGTRSGQKKPHPKLPRLCGYKCRDKGRFFGFKEGFGDCLCMDDATSIADCKIIKKDEHPMHLYEYKGRSYFMTKFHDVYNITRFKSNIRIQLQIETFSNIPPITKPSSTISP